MKRTSLLKIWRIRGSFAMPGLFLCLATAVLAQGPPPWAQGPPLWAGGPPAWQGYATVPTVGSGEMRTFSWIRQDAGKAANASSPSGFTPSNMWAAYSIPSSGGAGVTVAIVDAYDSPNAASDLNNFIQTFSLPPFGKPCGSATPTFTKVNQSGGSSYPKRDSGWEVEINLDTQWAHAIAPCANILLVEANSSSNADLQTAVTYAMKHASIVSMSWGSNESSRQAQSQLAFEQVFANNPNGVTFVASSGDAGGIVSSPAASPNVIGVGGTQLVLSNGAYVETAWNGSGGGCSVVEKSNALSAQRSFIPTTCATRGTPDILNVGWWGECRCRVCFEAKRLVPGVRHQSVRSDVRGRCCHSKE